MNDAFDNAKDDKAILAKLTDEPRGVTFTVTFPHLRHSGISEALWAINNYMARVSGSLGMTIEHAKLPAPVGDESEPCEFNKAESWCLTHHCYPRTCLKRTVPAGLRPCPPSSHALLVNTCYAPKHSAAPFVAFRIMTCPTFPQHIAGTNLCHRLTVEGIDNQGEVADLWHGDDLGEALIRLTEHLRMDTDYLGYNHRDPKGGQS